MDTIVLTAPITDAKSGGITFLNACPGGLAEMNWIIGSWHSEEYA
jgi:hypothetical protein